MTLLLGKVMVAYLLGSLSGSLLLGRLRGVDIRSQGSGNAGGTNAFRTQGAVFALGVAVIDIGKGALAAWIGGLGPGEAGSLQMHAAAAGAAAVLGHCYPLWHGFRGGKGAATAVGVVALLMPALLAPMLGLWLLVLILSGWVSLATMAAALGLATFAMIWYEAWPLRLLALFLLVLIVFAHRANIARLYRGEEYRFARARLLHRLFGK
ncbi:MAG TPA: glycerol-3-phosphate 1-O-acyltransferase PlsY [Xanthomonadaceae bacterium]|nr:glycerol-3-phosphate 1-O-acyltransferase PlsY [Xanthomonadaceae bacterium]